MKYPVPFGAVLGAAASALALTLTFASDEVQGVSVFAWAVVVLVEVALIATWLSLRSIWRAVHQDRRRL